MFKAIGGYVSFLRVIVCKKPKLVHIHSSFGPSFYRKIPFIYMATWFKIPIINHIHGADFTEFYINASARKKKLIQKVYNRCDILIALSEEWKERLGQIVTKDKIEVIENYSILHYDAVDDLLQRDCNNTVLFLGEIGKRKGCYDIPKVIKLVIEQIPTVKFILGGSGSPEDEENIKRQCIALGVQQNVEFPGWVRGNEKDMLLRKADVFFLPSYNEGMPMSILDAMGYGLPVVSTNVGGISRIVHDGKNGICCNPGDIDTFSKGIVRLLLDNQFRNDCVKTSFEIVRKGYSLEVHIKRIQNVYERISN